MKNITVKEQENIGIKNADCSFIVSNVENVILRGLIRLG